MSDNRNSPNVRRLWSASSTLPEIKVGETVVVWAAAGAVGSSRPDRADQGLPRNRNRWWCQKCRHVVADLGFDDCIDYQVGPIEPALAKAAPQGIDIYFDNVGVS